MRIRRPRARLAGILAITVVIALQAVPGFGCHGQDLRRFAIGLGVFVLPPLLPALASLATANPLRAVGACALFAPWRLWTGYVDCIRPDAGGVHGVCAGTAVRLPQRRAGCGPGRAGMPPAGHRHRSLIRAVLPGQGHGACGMRLIRIIINACSSATQDGRTDPHPPMQRGERRGTPRQQAAQPGTGRMSGRPGRFRCRHRHATGPCRPCLKPPSQLACAGGAVARRPASHVLPGAVT